MKKKKKKKKRKEKKKKKKWDEMKQVEGKAVETWRQLMIIHRAARNVRLVLRQLKWELNTSARGAANNFK